jgi:hypothetical protein
VNATTSPPPPTAPDRPSALSTPPQVPAGDSCPLCGAPLRAEQEWCLRCGAAARTRLAAAPNWKAPTAALAVVIALSLGVLAAALVKLAGDSSSSGAAATTIVTTAPAGSTPASPPPAAAVPGANSSTPTTPGATGPDAGTPRTNAPAASSPGSSGSRSPGQKQTGKVPPNLGGATGTKGTGILSAKQRRELRELRVRLPRRGTK